MVVISSSVHSMTPEDITAALRGKWHGTYGLAFCPAHPNTDTPALSISPGQKQAVVLKCHTGCTFDAIDAALRARGIHVRDDRPFTPPVLPVDDVKPESWLEQAPMNVTPISREVATHDYYDADGVLLYQKLRYEPKTFKVRAADGSWGLNGQAPVLYRLPELLKSPIEAPVFLVEGEKDADNLAALGFTATCNHDGASGGWKPQYDEPLRGRHIVIIPDNDDAGEKHATAYREAALRVAKSVKVLRLGGLPPKGDVSDWLEMGGTAAQLSLLVAETQAEGERYPFLSVDDIMSMESPRYLADGWLVQETLSVVYGPSGVGKSFAALDLACSVASGTEWLGAIPVAQGDVLYVLAEGTGGMKERLRAWIAAHPVADLSRLRFLTVAVNLLEPEQVHALHAAIRAQLPNPTLVIFDTLARSMSGGDENSAKDMGMLVAAADSVRTTFQCHVILVHHTGKNGDSERGSSSLRAACDTSIYLANDNGLIMECMKQKDSKVPEKIGLKLVPVNGTESCVLEPLDLTGEVTETAMRLLRILAESFPLEEGASSTAWLAASGLTDRTFYRSRTILVRNRCVIKQGKNAPNMLTDIGCRDLDIQPSDVTPSVTAITATELPWQ